MGYKLLITPKAKKELNKIPSKLALTISKKISALENNPYPINSKKLAGQNNYRIRVGSFRAIYTINKKQKEIIILRVADRKTIYK